MRKHRIVVFVMMLLVFPAVCFASDRAAQDKHCMGVKKTLPGKELAASIIRVFNQEMSTKEEIEEPVVVDRLERYMGKDGWHIVWATPRNMERGVFILHGNATSLEYIGVWGGTAFPEEESSVLEWFKGQAPDAPASLLECVAHAVTHAGVQKTGKGHPTRR
jgi:hypothetical protein